MTMTLVSTVTVGSGGAASIEFTGIAGTGKDLLLVVSARGTNNSERISLTCSMNSTARTGTRALVGSGTTVVESNTYENISIPASQGTSNVFGSAQLYISNYASSSDKSWSNEAVVLHNTSTSGTLAQINANATNYASPVTSIVLACGAGNFAQYSTASLYIIS